MQIFWEVTGYYERFTSEGQAVSETSLTALLSDLRAIATAQSHHHLPTVHQSFGLNFLPVNTVTQLMQQTTGRSALITDETLRPYLENPNNLSSQQFSYRFVAAQLTKPINLKSDDPQIPSNLSDRCAGTYSIQLKNPNIPIFIEAKNNLIQLIRENPLQIINLAIRSRNSELIAIPLPKNCTAWIKPTQLSPDLQHSIRILKNAAGRITISENIQSLINAYRIKYSESIIISDQLPNLVTNQTEPSTKFIIGKGIHRQALEDLITNAKKFLLICSYRLEDSRIVEILAEKSQQIPVWILTDFNQDVQDRVDLNMEGRTRTNPDYRNSDRKKQNCLQMLSKANLGLRSGNFHLKTYISEQSAYLGSCNLTGGSLERNGEAGILWQNTPEHQFLIDYFSYLWQHETTKQSIPTPTGFRDESLANQIGASPHNELILDHHAFKQDLSATLQRFSRQEIHIYTRNFQPLPPQFNFLTNSKIVYGNYNSTRLRSTKIPNLHAKIIIIGSQVAYIGSQDVAFSHNPLIDLTYKTTKPEEIQLITQQLRNLH